MFDKTDQEIEAWVRQVTPDSTVVLGRPREQDEKATVTLFLLDAIPESARMRAPRPLGVTLRYLVTTSGPDSVDSHRRLGNLMFAAMDHADWDVEQGCNEPGLWAALGLAPRPGFRLLVPVRSARAVRKQPLVRAPLEVRRSPMKSVHGVVLGPGEVGIADARVEWVGLNLWTRTDARGRFRFPAAPPLESGQLRLDVKGRVVVIPGKDLHPSSRGVEIHVTNLEA